MDFNSNRESFVYMLRQTSQAIPKWAPDFSKPDVIKVWGSALSDIDMSVLMGVLQECMKTQDEFPSIAKIRRMAIGGTQLSDADLAEEISSRIEASISRFGYTNPTSAEKFIGDLGWRVVQMHGGWINLCDIQNNELISARRSWRELARTLAKKAFLGELDKTPTLPSGSNRKTLEDGSSGSLALTVAAKYIQDKK